MLVQRLLLIIMSISELARDRPTAFEPKREIFVGGNRDEIKNAIN